MKDLTKFLFLVTGGALAGVILDTIINNKVSSESLCFFIGCVWTHLVAFVYTVVHSDNETK